MERPVKNVVVLASGSGTLLQALLDDGWVTSLESAQAMMEELLAAQRAHLPRFSA